MLKRALFACALVARLAHAQAAVSGTVRDTLSRRPLAGAIVQLAGADSVSRVSLSSTSDSLGRFSFRDVPSGRYIIGFLHPLLDSIGVEPTVHELRVAGNRAVRFDLATPAASQLRSAVCAGPSRRDSSSAVIGVVRDARREPIRGANVTVEWLEVAIAAGSIGQRTAHLSTTSTTNGWFSLCGLPSAGMIFLTASNGLSATDTIPLTIPDDQLVRQDVYLGAGEAARMHGVVTGPGGSPLSGAQIVRVGGTEARSDENGQWSMDAPAGTRMIEVRAIGFYPRQLPIEALDETPSVRVSLSTMKAMLDTVRITATRNDLAKTGFEKRRHSTMGRFLTAEDISHRAAIMTSDIFKMVPRMRVSNSRGFTSIAMPGTVDALCTPRFFIDGVFMPGFGAEELDSFVQPEEIAGIEIYSSGQVPGDFMMGTMSFAANGTIADPCGAIVIWTSSASRRPLTWGRAFGALAAATAGILLGLVVFHGR